MWLQERAYAEIISEAGTSKEDVSVAELKTMTYLDQVIREALRLFPAIPLISRSNREDMELSE